LSLLGEQDVLAGLLGLGTVLETPGSMGCDLIHEDDIEDARVATFVDYPYNGPDGQAIISWAAQGVVAATPSTGIGANRWCGDD
jgi:hypothetical protein